MRRRGARSARQGWSVAVVAAIACGACLSPGLARAEQTLPPVELWLGPCDGVDGAALRRLAALELGAVAPAEDGRRPRATIACERGGATVEVRDSSGVTRRRHVDLDAEPAETRTRLLALVLAEVVEQDSRARRARLRRRPLALIPSPTVRRSLPRPGRDARPTRDLDVAGLRILEQEAGRYGDRSSGYLATVVAIARREYERRRQVLVRHHDERLAEETVRLDEARRQAIADYEAFVARHADDPVATAGARLRLAELAHEELHEGEEGE